jgi:multidrug efflux system membrane fusion protein
VPRYAKLSIGLVGLIAVAWGLPPVPVTAAEVARQDVPIVLECLEGQKVKRGQTLAEIDPRTIQAALDQAIATRDRDQAHLDNAKVNLGRDVPLLKRGYATGQQVDTQTAQITQLQDTVKADEALVDAARTELSYTTITAPFDGVTGIRLIDPGNIVHPNDPTGLVVVTQVQPITSA